jgi:hypothetical protein
MVENMGVDNQSITLEFEKRSVRFDVRLSFSVP